MTTLRSACHQRSRPGLVLLASLACAFAAPAVASAQVLPDSLPFRNPDLPIATRVADLISRLTLQEKAGELGTNSKGIPRLDIPAYEFQDEANHGVMFPAPATVFPQAIAIAATWDTAMMGKVASTISDEARAKYRGMLDSMPMKGGKDELSALTFFAPNINLYRDPRWGRGQEAYGEDPFLAGRMGVAFAKGMQGDDSVYLKTVATAKHYAVHSGPESERNHFEATVSQYDLTDTYLPHFEAIVREGGIYAVMSAYSGANGVPMTGNPTFLTQYLRDKWGFKGYVVSDCGAVEQLADDHHFVKDHAEASATAIKAGLDLACWGEPSQTVPEAVQRGLLTEAQVDTALARVLTARFRLGMFDPISRSPYANIQASDVETPEHLAVALDAGREAMTLLKNERFHGHELLPLALERGQTIALLGPMAKDGKQLYGNYAGTGSHDISLLEGLTQRAESAGVKVNAVEGTDLEGEDISLLDSAVSVAQKSDVVVLALGVRGEPGEGQDFTSLDLPGGQELLLERVVATGKPVVLVLVTGHSLSVRWAAEHVPAILLAWYPGERGGTAIANALFGDINPAGRLPITFYRSMNDLPPYENYDMRLAPGRTYRYFTGTPLFRFGYGLSYTTFKYSDLQLPSNAVTTGDSVHLSVNVSNTGSRDGDAVVEVYVTKTSPADERPGGRPSRPIRALAAFRRVPLKAGEQQQVTLTLRPAALASVTEDGQRLAQPGKFEIAVGGQQPGTGNHYESDATGVTGTIEVTGSSVAIP